jgi:hypothetical protein
MVVDPARDNEEGGAVSVLRVRADPQHGQPIGYRLSNAAVSVSCEPPCCASMPT